MPTIRLATDDDLRQISSQNSADLLAFPFVYVPDGDAMVPRGVARADGGASVAFWARQHPDALVAPKFMGECVERGELLYNGAEPAAEF